MKHEYGYEILPKDPLPRLELYQAVVLCVAHKKFLEIKIQKNSRQVLFDVKSFWKKEDVDGRL